MNRPIALAALGGALVGFCHAVGEYAWGAAVNKLVPTSQSDFWTPLLKLFAASDSLLKRCFAGEAVGLVICLLVAVEVCGIWRLVAQKPVPAWAWLRALAQLWLAGVWVGVVFWNTHFRDVWYYEDVLNLFGYVATSVSLYVFCVCLPLMASHGKVLSRVAAMAAVAAVGLSLAMAILSGFRLYTWLGYELPGGYRWVEPIMNVAWDWREVCYLAGPVAFVFATVLVGLTAAGSVAAALAGRRKAAVLLGVISLMVLQGVRLQHDLARDPSATMGLTMVDSVPSSVVRLSGTRCELQSCPAHRTWRTPENLKRLEDWAAHGNPSSIMVQDAISLLANDALCRWDEDDAIRYLLSNRSRTFDAMHNWEFATEALGRRPATAAAIQSCETLTDPIRWMPMGTYPYVVLATLLNHVGLVADARHFAELGNPDHDADLDRSVAASAAPVSGVMSGRIMLDGRPLVGVPLLLVPQGSSWLAEDDPARFDEAWFDTVRRLHSCQLGEVRSLSDTVHAVTDARGGFRFEPVPVGGYVLCVRVPGSYAHVSLQGGAPALEVTHHRTDVDCGTVALTSR